MILEHAIYGSSTGLGDYRVLGVSPRFREQWRTPIEYHSSLGWSALNTPFLPIFSYYTLGTNLWAFTRTHDLGQTPRGNDYFVHAIILDRETLAQIDYRPFAIANAFVSFIPAQRALQPLTISIGDTVSSDRAGGRLPSPVIAASLRALAWGPLRLRIDTGDAVEICREIHESLPPEDRMRTTFCTRFSYGRDLEFRLSAFVQADEDRLRALTGGTGMVAHPLANATTPDLFDRWATEVRGNPDLDLVGPSVLNDAADAFALLEGVRKLRLWTTGERGVVSDVGALARAAATVLSKENSHRANVQPLLPGALAVDLCNRVRVAQAFDESAARSNEMTYDVRRQAVQWIRQLRTTPTEAWMAELLLRLPDDSLDAMAESLKRTDPLGPGAAAYRAYLSTIMAGLRDRFGTAAAARLAAIHAELPAEARMHFVQVLEEASPQDPEATRAQWLLAIARAKSITPAVAGRIVLTHRLLDSLNDEEIGALAPVFLGMEEKLAQALPAIPEGAAIDRALASELKNRLRIGWRPRTSFAAEIVRRIFLGASTGHFPRRTAADLTIAAFLITRRDDRAQFSSALPTAIERLTRSDLTPDQATLLIRALFRLGRVSVKRRTLHSLDRAARRRKPRSVLNSLWRHVRHTALSEVRK